MFDDTIIADMESDEKLSPIVTELFLRRIILIFHLFFISQFYFKVPKTIAINTVHYFIMKISSKRELQQIASNHSLYTDLKDFRTL